MATSPSAGTLRYTLTNAMLQRDLSNYYGDELDERMGVMHCDPAEATADLWLFVPPFRPQVPCTSHEASTPSNSAQQPTASTGDGFDLKPLLTSLRYTFGAGLSLPTVSFAKDFRFNCSVASCKMGFMLQEELDNHTKWHNGNFSCAFCPRIESFAPDLADHELSKHAPVNRAHLDKDKQTFNCPRCLFCHPDRDTLLNHFFRKHLKLQSSILCPLCKRPFFGLDTTSIRRLILVHFACHHDVSNLKMSEHRTCGLCPAFFSTSFGLSDHLTRIHRACPPCNVVFDTNKEVREHLREVHNGEPQLALECSWPECGKQFETGMELEMHRIYAHVFKTTARRCGTCGKDCGGSSYELFHHFITAHYRRREAALICEGCGNGWKSKKEFDKHQCPTGDLPFKCVVCGRKFVSHKVMASHLETHFEPKEQVPVAQNETTLPPRRSHVKKMKIGNSGLCNACGKVYDTPKALEEHYCPESRKFPCDQCGMRFKTMDILFDHVSILHPRHYERLQQSTSSSTRTAPNPVVTVSTTSPSTKQTRIYAKTKKRKSANLSTTTPPAEASPVGMFRCRNCNIMFPRRTDYVEHMTGVHGSTLFAREK